MRTEQKVFNDLIETIVRNSENNIATITDVKLWAKNWQTEMEQELTLTDVNYSRPNYKTEKKQSTLYGVMQRFFKIIVFLISIAFIVLIGLDVIIYQFPKWIITGKELELRLNTWGRLMDYVLNVA